MSKLFMYGTSLKRMEQQLIYKFYCGKVEFTKEDTKSEE